MSVSKSLVAAGIAAVLAGAVPPAFAQRHGGGGGGGSRAASPRGSGGSSRGDSRPASPRSTPVARSANPRGGYYGQGRVAYYGHGHVAPRYSTVAPVRFYRPYYTFQPHLSLGFGLWAGYPFAYSYGFYNPFYYPYGYGYAAPYVYSPYGYTTPNAYPPYSTPNGYPPYGYPGTTYPASPSGSGYPAPSAALPGQDPQNSVGVQLPGQPDTGGVILGQADTGGVSFEITPNTAQLFVDGVLEGTVGQFTPTSQPLGVAVGHHQIEVRAPGYQTMSFEVDIIAGQVIPYQGAMER